MQMPEPAGKDFGRRQHALVRPEGIRPHVIAHAPLADGSLNAQRLNERGFRLRDLGRVGRLIARQALVVLAEGGVNPVDGVAPKVEHRLGFRIQPRQQGVGLDHAEFVVVHGKIIQAAQRYVPAFGGQNRARFRIGDLQHDLRGLLSAERRYVRQHGRLDLEKNESPA